MKQDKAATRWVFFLLPGIMVVAACGQFPSPFNAANPIKIGLIAPLSSGVSASAQAVVGGAQLAVDEMNAEKGVKGRQLSMTVVDDHGVPEEAVRFVEQLAGQGAVALVGPVTDATTIAAAGAAERVKILLISPGATATLPYGGHFVFRTALPARAQAAAVARHLVRTLGIRRIAAVYDSNEYGNTVALAFDEAVSAMGATITSRRLYRDGDTDFTRHVRGALAEQAQAVFLASYPDEGALLLRQFRAAAPELVIAGSDALYSEDTLAWAGAAANGLFVATGFVAETSLPIVRDFTAKYRQAYGRAPDQFAAQAYDAVRVLVFAMRRAGVDRQKIRDTIATLKRFPGVTGEISFDRWGDPGRDVIIARVKDGAFVPVSP